MRIELTDQELDYVHRVLMTRPMAEAEPIVNRIRQQVAQAQGAGARDDPGAGLHAGPGRANGADQGDDSLPLP